MDTKKSSCISIGPVGAALKTRWRRWCEEDIRTRGSKTYAKTLAVSFAQVEQTEWLSDTQVAPHCWPEALSKSLSQTSDVAASVDQQLH